MRVRHLALIMITLGIGFLATEAANSLGWLTGGADGLQGVRVWKLLGLFEFDATYGFVSLDTARRLLGKEAVDFIQLRVDDMWAAPETAVAVEDPMFSGNPVAMWSYPVIKDGLIYVTDVRNGLYVLRYVGPKQEMVADVAFAEGNSSLP